MQQRKKPKQSLALLAALAAPFTIFPNDSLAQQSSASEKTLPPVVVTASRAPRTLGEDIADISVITREEIDRAGQQSVADLLQQQPGIEMGRNGGAGSTTSLFLRGTNSNHVVVLIDGVRINSATTGAAAWEKLPLSQIERIEILRGPASGLYGADAIGGVIQIFTRSGGKGLGGDISAGVGSNSLNNQTVNLRGGSKAVRFSLTAGQEASHGFHAKPKLPADGDRDGYQAKNAGATVDVAFNKDHSLALQLMQNRLTNQFDTGSAFDNRSVQYADIFALTSRNRLHANWLSTVRLAQSRDKYSDVASYGNSLINTRQNQVGWQNDFTLGEHHVLQLAAEQRDEKLDSNPVYDRTGRRTNSLIGLYQLNYSEHSAQLNVRHDDSNQYGGKVTGGLGYGYRFLPQWRAIVSAGTAFHAPTFNNLYYPGFSNPNLRPEQAKNIEAAVQYRKAEDVLSLTAYHNRVRDLIDPSNVNINSAKLQGVTLQGSTAFGKLYINGSWDWQKAINEATGKMLIRRARQHGAIKASYQMAQITLGGELLFSGMRYEDTNNTVRMGGYAVLNLFTTWRIDRQWELLARWNNVLDKQYELVKDYQTPRSNGYLGLRYQFGNK